ncbi:hypothetical protein A3C59_03180 [Candidatus Daviesbacteria bacterium RIFCSPHIGHO2_02_FULL_36_13]|uniref:Uncharacterized protein n=1 Tax=Candidatus Daviesbacteria bacterium RIFCSPHIGHO2_02_FULL_36_13 TaxID=1797768 RepID=A0A1F5JPY4_9BACT|nr:MAG: hypothetical protein A3C59_03180 [Candidatus Daviesbacteria bacterium RIFCSPHIGHO2_02_FULL_36_13]OGE44670.1 MAG: hypothetical protein A3A45_02350 [Candidatus Daviesbacteria bacterium RIFCSPLOWO2_01_FULL_36_8]
MSESSGDNNSQIGIVSSEGKILRPDVPPVVRSKTGPGEPRFSDEGVLRQRKGKVSKQPSLVRVGR